MYSVGDRTMVKIEEIFWKADTTQSPVSLCVWGRMEQRPDPVLRRSHKLCLPEHLYSP